MSLLRVSSDRLDVECFVSSFSKDLTLLMPQMESATDADLITTPAQGVPPVTDTAKGFAQACELLGAGSGPVAVDTERAASFRYSSRAYLLQFRRENCGTFLIDPLPFSDFSPLRQALADTTWVFHAADQDIPCLLELDLRPPRIFDTEVAAQFLAFDHIGLAAVMRQVLGKDLAKEFSAVDWSTRPLPIEWLTYAALDVELLVELEQVLADRLEQEGKTSWAQEEFAHICAMDAPTAKAHPWRHVNGAGKLRKPRQLAALRELWKEREQVAQSQDLAPTKVLSNKAMIAMATDLPRNRRMLSSLPPIKNDRRSREHLDLWMRAIRTALALPVEQLPTRLRPEPGSAPTVRNWHREYPDAAFRLEALRAAVTSRAQEISVASELLLAPRVVKKLAWVLQGATSSRELTLVLESLGARQWQIENTVPYLSRALAQS